MSNGTVVGSPTFGAAKFSNGLTSTSDSNYISLPADAINITTGSSWMIGAWLKTTSTTLSVALGMGTSSTANVWMGVNASGHLCFSIYGTGAFSTGPVLDSGITINDGAWHFCVIQMTGGTSLASYVDSTAGAVFTGTINPISTSGAIGKFAAQGGFSWPGAIDEVVFFNDAVYTGATPTSPYAGTETSISSLYHLQADGTNSVVSTNVTILPNDSGILYSPYNWVVTSGAAKTINSGAYFRTIFSGTSVALLMDLFNAVGPYSQFWARIDGDAWQQFSINNTVLIASGLQSRKHLLEVVVKSTSETLTRWASNSQTMLSFLGIQIDAGASVTAPLARTKRVLMYGDSITEGVRTVNSTATYDTDRNDVLSDYSYALGTAVDAEIGIVGFGATGITTGGSGGVPALPSSYNLVYSGASRSFSPAPDLVIYNEGTNDGGSITSGLETVVNAIIAAAPNSKHLLLCPFNGSHASEIQAAVAAIGSANVHYQSTTGWFNSADSSDGLHPYGYAHLCSIAPHLFPVVARFLYQGTVGTFS